MKHNVFTYKPFFHDNFDIKKSVLDIARTQDITTVPGVLTSVLINVNAVDYVAGHLYKHFQIMQSLITFNELNSVVYANCDVMRYNLTLGELIKKLEVYEFPEKSDFIQGLKEFNNLRNKYIHNLLSLSKKELNSSSKDFKKIIDLGNILLDKFDTISRLISKEFLNYQGILRQKSYPEQSK